MTRNKLKRYTGAEVAQPKSIAQQLLEGTKLGNLLYGKQETYKDGYGREMSEPSFKESANGQLVQRMGDTVKGVGRTIAENFLDVPMDVYSGIESGVKGDWTGVGLSAASLFLPQMLEQGIKFGRNLKTLLPEFKNFLGKHADDFSDEQLIYILQNRIDDLSNLKGRHTISSPSRVELYDEGVMHGYLNLMEGRKGGLGIDDIENVTRVKGTPVSPELYYGGIRQSQDIGKEGLESGWHLRDEGATRRNINLENFDGYVIGTGKADTESLEDYIQRELKYEEMNLRQIGVDEDMIDMELDQLERKLRQNTKDMNEFEYTDEFKSREERQSFPYRTDAYMLTNSKQTYPTYSVFPDIESITHWKKTGEWDLTKYHKQGGKLPLYLKHFNYKQ